MVSTHLPHTVPAAERVPIFWRHGPGQDDLPDRRAAHRPTQADVHIGWIVPTPTRRARFRHTPAMSEPEFGGVIGPSWRESTPWWPPEPRRPRARRTCADRARRRRVRAARLLRLGHRHTEHRPARRRWGAVRELPHDRAVLADPRVPADRAQPPLERDGAGSPTWRSASPATAAASRDGTGSCSEILAANGYVPSPSASGTSPRRTRRTPRRRAGAGPSVAGSSAGTDSTAARRTSSCPTLFQDNHAVPPPRTPEQGYHLSEDLADRAIRYLGDVRSVEPDQPFFLYFATGACHSPHHAPPRVDRALPRAGSTAAGTRGATRRSPASRRWGCCHRGHAALAPTAVGAGVGRPRARGPARRGALHGVLRRLPVARRRADRAGARRSSRSSASATTRSSCSCRTTARAPRAASAARSTTRASGTASPPAGGSCASASTSSARRPRTTTTRGAGRWRATRRSGAGSARSTRAASPTRASSLAARRRRPRRDPAPVRARDRRAAHDPRADRRRAAGGARRRRAEPDRRDELRLPARDARRARAPHDPVLRDARQPRHLPRRLEGGDVQAARRRCTTTASIPTRRSRTTCGSCTTSPRTSPSATTSPRQEPGEARGARRALVGGGARVPGAPARQPPDRRAARAAPAVRHDRDRYVFCPGGAPVPENVTVNVRNRTHTITAQVEIPDGGAAEGVLLAMGPCSAAGRSTCSTAGCGTCTTTSGKERARVTSDDRRAGRRARARVLVRRATATSAAPGALLRRRTRRRRGRDPADHARCATRSPAAGSRAAGSRARRSATATRRRSGSPARCTGSSSRSTASRTATRGRVRGDHGGAMSDPFPCARRCRRDAFVRRDESWSMEIETASLPGYLDGPLPVEPRPPTTLRQIWSGLAALARGAHRTPTTGWGASAGFLDRVGSTLPFTARARPQRAPSVRMVDVPGDSLGAVVQTWWERAARAEVLEIGRRLRAAQPRLPARDLRGVAVARTAPARPAVVVAAAGRLTRALTPAQRMELAVLATATARTPDVAVLPDRTRAGGRDRRRVDPHCNEDLPVVRYVTSDVPRRRRSAPARSSRYGESTYAQDIRSLRRRAGAGSLAAAGGAPSGSAARAGSATGWSTSPGTRSVAPCCATPRRSPTRRASRRPGVVVPLEDRILGELDPPQHTAVRRVMVTALTPEGGARRPKPFIRETAAARCWPRCRCPGTPTSCPRSPCRCPNRVTVHLLGLPAERRRHHRRLGEGAHGERLPARPTAPSAARASPTPSPSSRATSTTRSPTRAATDAGARRASRTRCSPGCSQLEVDGERLSRRQLRALVRNLITGGLTTTSQLLGNLAPPRS